MMEVGCERERKRSNCSLVQRKLSFVAALKKKEKKSKPNGRLMCLSLFMCKCECVRCPYPNACLFSPSLHNQLDADTFFPPSVWGVIVEARKSNYWGSDRIKTYYAMHPPLRVECLAADEDIVPVIRQTCTHTTNKQMTMVLMPGQESDN